MKHPFYTLYYTGLAVLISFSLFSGLLIYNLSNIVDLIPKEQTPKINTDVVINPTVLGTSTLKTSIELNNPKVVKKEVDKNLKSQTTIQHNDSTTTNTNSGESTTPNTGEIKDSTQKIP